MGKIFIDVWEVKEQALDAMARLAYVTEKHNGAETMFVGTVRNHNLGKKVLGVSYDVFELLAKQSFLKICQEALQKWTISSISILCMHNVDGDNEWTKGCELCTHSHTDEVHNISKPLAKNGS